MSANNFGFLTREKFNEILEAYLNELPENRRAKAVLSQEMVDRAIRVLRDPKMRDNLKFKSWARNRFTTMNIGNVTKLIEKKSNRPVCPKENLYDVICTLHRLTQHSGYKKTYHEVSRYRI